MHTTWANAKHAQQRLRAHLHKAAHAPFWANDAPPCGQALLDLTATVIGDATRNNDQVKAERIKKWSDRMRGLNHDGGRAKAQWVKAANTASTKYLRSPHKGSPDDPAGVYPHDSSTTDVPPDEIDEDSDSDDHSLDADGPVFDAGGDRIHMVGDQQNMYDMLCPKADPDSMAGLQHICDNLCRDTHEGLDYWPVFFADLKNMEAFMRFSGRRRKFITTCIRNTRLQHLEFLFEHFSASLYEARWREVLFFSESRIPSHSSFVSRVLCRQV